MRARGHQIEVRLDDFFICQSLEGKDSRYGRPTPKEQDQINMVLRNLQLRFVRCLVGILFKDFRSLVHVVFNEEEGIAQGLWTYTTFSSNSKEKKLLDHLGGLERSTLSVINVKGLLITQIIGLLQLELIFLIHNIIINKLMFNNLPLLKLVCDHDRHIREPLLLNYLDHMFRDLRDSLLHQA